MSGVACKVWNVWNVWSVEWGGGWECAVGEVLSVKCGVENVECKLPSMRNVWNVWNAKCGG